MLTKKPFGLTSAGLHILAMALMLCDHLWATTSGPDWLTAVGRLAFPIFAFLIVEGYCHTSSFRRYCLRLLIAAVLSEVPFDLMTGYGVFYPFHQNVLWTFLLALVLIRAMEKAQGKTWRVILVSALAILVGYYGGYLLMGDYYGAGVLTVLAFWFFRQRKWWSWVGLVLAMGYIHTQLLTGFGWTLTLGSWSFFLPQQALAVLSLLPIALYRGRQGHHSKPFRWFCYAFYPAHMLVLWALFVA